jgi:hypothetical protein
MKKALTLACAFVALGLLLSLSAAQEERKGESVGPVGRCPQPFQKHIDLTAPPPLQATPYLPDFSTSPCSAGWEPNFGGTTINRCFRHTFTWKPPSAECRCLSGELIIKYKALQGGPVGSSTSVNDTMSLASGGSGIPGTSQTLYAGAVTTGQTGTKTIPLNCDWLKNNRLSFAVQDDTSVTSATLHLVYCCSSCPPGKVEMTFPGTSIKYCCEGKPGDRQFCCTAQERPR